MILSSVPSSNSSDTVYYNLVSMLPESLKYHDDIVGLAQTMQDYLNNGYKLIPECMSLDDYINIKTRLIRSKIDNHEPDAISESEYSSLVGELSIEYKQKYEEIYTSRKPFDHTSRHIPVDVPEGSIASEYPDIVLTKNRSSLYITGDDYDYNRDIDTFAIPDDIIDAYKAKYSKISTSFAKTKLWNSLKGYTDWIRVTRNVDIYSGDIQGISNIEMVIRTCSGNYPGAELPDIYESTMALGEAMLVYKDLAAKEIYVDIHISHINFIKKFRGFEYEFIVNGINEPFNPYNGGGICYGYDSYYNKTVTDTNASKVMIDKTITVTIPVSKLDVNIGKSTVVLSTLTSTINSDYIKPSSVITKTLKDLFCSTGNGIVRCTIRAVFDTVSKILSGIIPVDAYRQVLKTEKAGIWSDSAIRRIGDSTRFFCSDLYLTREWHDPRNFYMYMLMMNGTNNSSSSLEPGYALNEHNEKIRYDVNAYRHESYGPLIDRVRKLAYTKDPYVVDYDYISLVADHFGFNIDVGIDDIENNSYYRTKEEKQDLVRSIIARLPEFYRMKTTKNMLESILLSFGMVVRIINLYTRGKYEAFANSEIITNYTGIKPSDIDEPFTSYDNVIKSGINNWYPSPHFYVKLDFGSGYTGQSGQEVSSLANDIGKAFKIVSKMKPVNTVFLGFSLKMMSVYSSFWVRIGQGRKSIRSVSFTKA